MGEAAVVGEHEFGSAEILDVLSRLVHREVLKLAVLIAIAFAAFFVTRVIAANNRATTRHNAQIWYERGQQQLAHGRIADAIDSFRHARLGNRQERSYSLALARALAANRDTAGAHNALLELRRATPEDPDVNLALARLAANRHDTPEAVRYYQYALYAPRTAEQSERRRQIRIEMIRFLLDERRADRAVPELIALSTDLPAAPAFRVDVAQLFSRAGDQRRALEQFQALLRRVPNDQAALAGAARAAFELRDYAQAARYVRQLSAPAPDLAQLRRVAEEVLSGDPLAARISPATRSRRLRDNFRFADARLRDCLASKSAMADSGAIQLQAESARFKEQLTARRARSDDVLDAGVALIYRMERAATALCPPATARDRALLIIGERHGAEQS